MRTLNAEAVISAVAALCEHVNRYLPQDVREALAGGEAAESSPRAVGIFRELRANHALAAESGLPLCQDTGLAVCFVELGQDLRIEGMNIREAVNQGVRQGYMRGKLRASVCRPLSRDNTGDNTPAVVHFDIVPGDKLRIALMAKGGGSENMSGAAMLTPAHGWEGIRAFVLRRVAEAGANPCPPIVVGLGIGGNFELAPLLAKKALLRPLGDANPDPDLDAREKSLLADINKLGIGPMGLGGAITALDVKIAVAPCHIASLPLAVNIQCHSSRHGKVEL